MPEHLLRAYEERRKGDTPGVARVVLPDRELVDGVEVETDLGTWRVYETPGHAPSHVVLHQPERRLLLSGDHLLGRVSLYYDYGYTPDPAGEFLRSLDVVEPLDVGLVLPGHGRPFRDAAALIDANRRTVRERIERVRATIAGEELTPFEIVARILGEAPRNEYVISWVLSETLCYLRYLEVRGAAECAERDGQRYWRTVPSAAPGARV
ncbi:hypothetical protein HRbin41_01111 [bacterium HR41]|nr:hypothetical protein HRbin41_01111 [bacterium HR41]